MHSQLAHQQEHEKRCAVPCGVRTPTQNLVALLLDAIASFRKKIECPFCERLRILVVLDVEVVGIPLFVRIVMVPPSKSTSSHIRVTVSLKRIPVMAVKSIICRYGAGSSTATVIHSSSVHFGSRCFDFVM